MKISVIIPAYNCAEYIAQTLSCIAGQTFPLSEIEVIVYLDACPDNTPQRVKEFIADNPSLAIQVIQGHKNKGASYARNTALKYARGEYIHFMDSDDVINTDFYQTLYNSATRAHADVAVASFVNEASAAASDIYDTELLLSAPQDKLDCTHVDRNGYSVRYLVRREFWLREKLRFPTNMHYCEDLFLMTRMIYLSNIVVTVPGALYIYKRRTGSMLNKPTDGTARRMGWHLATEQVANFLVQHSLSPSRTKKRIKKYRLFGFLPIWYSIQYDDVVCFYLFGVRVMKTVHRIII